ncbi:FecR family protein [Stakelama tenebrarum]|uniref:FecR family protein n=1 Tax=Stakelama tenebrarum TaxID=2711215 RepID=UPI0019D13405|nr:FecR domain-containing protein [Sphingosinithalassobacter tenebrarum]
MTDAFAQDSIEAEAAAWVARLQGEPTPEAQAGLRAWLDADAAHADAFERATEIWAMIPGAALWLDAERETGAAAPDPAPAVRNRRPVLALAASLLLLLTFGGFWWAFADASGYTTRAGEQKVVTLDDGSRVALNTDSRVDVAFSSGLRHVRLERGEAMFEVAHDADRPFIVDAGNKQVRAIGTEFIVRRNGAEVTVTLIEGRVSVSDIAPRGDTAVPAPPAQLSPGERLTAPAQGQQMIARESIEVATAWRRGQAVFDDTPLAAAASELNRYGGPRLEIADPHVAALPVSGVFATNDTREFADAVAALHGLHVRKSGDIIQIVR